MEPFFDHIQIERSPTSQASRDPTNRTPRVSTAKTAEWLLTACSESSINTAEVETMETLDESGRENKQEYREKRYVTHRLFLQYPLYFGKTEFPPNFGFVAR